MTSQPNTTPPPASTGPDPAAADTALAQRAATSADMLTGLLTASMLDTAGRPARLPELTWPDGDPDLVRAVWDTALAVGYRAGRLAGRPQWAPDELERHRRALEDAGFGAMAALIGRTAAAVPSAALAHPADGETRPGAARGGAR